MTADKASDDFARFYAETSSRIYAFARIVAGHKAEDLAAEAFARALANWRTVGNHERPDSWVRRVIVNLMNSEGRRERVRRLYLARLRNASTPDYADAAGDRTALGAALTILSPRQRAVVALRYYHDLPLRDVAKALDCSISTASIHNRRALAKLRAALGEDFV